MVSFFKYLCYSKNYLESYFNSKIIEIISSLFQGFVATSKGLVAGDLTLNFNKKSITYIKSRGDLIPQEMYELSSIKTSVNFVLVVEKDTIFQKLLGDRDKCPEYLNCILITGKGEPDIATRILVNRLAEIEKLPTYILVDNDPYGFEIMCTYR